MVAFANASQYGNNAYIAPEASVQDGLIDLCILHPFPKWQAFGLGQKLFNRKMMDSNYWEHHRAKEITVTLHEPAVAHRDGEPFSVSKEIRIKIEAAALNVLV